VILGGNIENFLSLISLRNLSKLFSKIVIRKITYQALDLSKNALFSFFDVVLATSNLHAHVRQREHEPEPFKTYRDMGLGAGALLLAFTLRRLFRVIIKVELNTECLAKMVNTRTTRSNDTTDVFLINVELDELDEIR
jgi:hypothetical protein